MRLVPLLLSLAVLLVPQARAAGGMPTWSMVDQLTAQFERLAFTPEFGGAHRRGRLVRWDGPIRVGLAGKVDDRMIREVVHQLAILRPLVGLPIVMVGPEAPANLTVRFLETPSVGRVGRQRVDAPCAALVHDDRFVAHRAEVRIAATDDTRLRRHCLAEELTQALGLMADSPLIHRSIFNDADRDTGLSRWDSLMVHTLYHPDLRPGMTAGEARPLVRRILADGLDKLDWVMPWHQADATRPGDGR